MLVSGFHRRALAAGGPVVCIPMGRDQEGNAARVAARNAGTMLSVKAPVAAIRAAINEVVTAPRYREQARLLGHFITRDAQSSRAVEKMEGIAERATDTGRRTADAGA